MVSGPEIARAVKEFEESSVFSQKKSDIFRHHEQTPSFQSKLIQHVTNLARGFEKHGNPFLSEEGDLIHIETRDVMPSNVVETVWTIEDIGKLQAKTFTKERIKTRDKPLDATIKKNQFQLYSTQNTKFQSPSQSESKKLRKVRIFSQLYISTQTTGGDIGEFFSYECLPYPPALSKGGTMRTGEKTDLPPCLKKLIPTRSSVAGVAAKVLEGSVLVNIIKPGKEKNFMEYVENRLIPYIEKDLESCNRIDVAFDTYKKTV